MSKDPDEKPAQDEPDSITVGPIPFRADPSVPVGELRLEIEPAPGSPAAAIRALQAALRANPAAFAREYMNQPFELPAPARKDPRVLEGQELPESLWPGFVKQFREQLAGPGMVRVIQRWLANRAAGVDIGEGAGVLLDELLEVTGPLEGLPPIATMDGHAADFDGARGLTLVTVSTDRIRADLMAALIRRGWTRRGPFNMTRGSDELRIVTDLEGLQATLGVHPDCSVRIPAIQNIPPRRP